MIGVFERVESYKTEKMKSAAYNVFISGQKYSSGFKNLAQGLVPGQEVAFNTETKGTFTNVVSIIPTGNVPVTPPPPPPLSAPAIPLVPAPVPPVPVSQSGVPSRAEQFITVDRREALRIASELVVARINHPNGPQSTPQLARMLAEVSALADHLVSYIQTGVTEPLSAEEVQKLREVVMSTEV